MKQIIIDGMPIDGKLNQAGLIALGTKTHFLDKQGATMAVAQIVAVFRLTPLEINSAIEQLNQMGGEG